jgi:hypothetical protein
MGNLLKKAFILIAIITIYSNGVNAQGVITSFPASPNFCVGQGQGPQGINLTIEGSGVSARDMLNNGYYVVWSPPSGVVMTPPVSLFGEQSPRNNMELFDAGLKQSFNVHSAGTYTVTATLHYGNEHLTIYFTFTVSGTPDINIIDHQGGSMTTLYMCYDDDHYDLIYNYVPNITTGSISILPNNGTLDVSLVPPSSGSSVGYVKFHNPLGGDPHTWFPRQYTVTIQVTNPGCGTDIKTIIVDVDNSNVCPTTPPSPGPLARVEENEASTDVQKNTFFEVFPNPSQSGVFNIKIENNLESNLKFEITDALGQNLPIQIKGNKANWKLDLSQFAKGIYYLKVINQEGFLIKRLVKD